MWIEFNPTWGPQWELGEDCGFEFCLGSERTSHTFFLSFVTSLEIRTLPLCGNENWSRLPGCVVGEHMLRILPVTQSPMWPQTSNLISQFLFLNLQEGVPAGVT